MNVISAGPFIVTLLAFVALAASVIVLAEYLLRPNARRAYAGGPRRYALALTVRAIAFTLPFPFVWIAFLGLSPQGLNFALALVVSYLVLAVVRYLPLTGPLLKELSRANAEAVLARQARS